MIRKETPLSMSESLEYLDKSKSEEIRSFIKKFTKIDEKKAKQIREKLIALKLLKLNEKNLAKIIDLLPENKEELNNFLYGANFDENESNAIIQTIKDTI